MVGVRFGWESAGYAPGVTVTTCPRRILLLVTVLALVAGSIGGCGDDDQEDDQPDEGTFCWLAVLNEPVAEADAPVLRRLDELAPGEVDSAVDVLREAAEELEDLEPGSPEHIALEFEIRFREGYIEARNEVEAFVAAECGDYLTEELDDGEAGDDSDDADDGDVEDSEDERRKVRPVDP